MKTKVLALHLPQYHRIPENDSWWGDGFTDWVNVRKARPLFKGHQQPVVPLNNNYYDLSEPEAIRQQAKLAKQYGIYGFCYYHYWFSGKKLLEKPCELLLHNKDIDIKYCFCWANESWARTWDGKEHDVLIQQEYGGSLDWIAHFDYLLPFFKDERYIRIDNKPVIFIYSCHRITDFDDMLACWRKLAQQHGFDGVYVAEFVNSFNSGLHSHTTDVIVEFEPLCTARYAISALDKAKRLFCKKMGRIDFQDYDSLWECLLNKRRIYGKKIWRSGFVSWDNSPRKGKRAMIVRGATPEKFAGYITRLLLNRERDYDDRFLVINAWNEWAEGAVLEPTEQDGYGYLEALAEALNRVEKEQEAAGCLDK